MLVAGSCGEFLRSVRRHAAAEGALNAGGKRAWKWQRELRTPGVSIPENVKMYCNIVQKCQKIPLSGKIGGVPPILPLRGIFWHF